MMSTPVIFVGGPWHGQVKISDFRRLGPEFRVPYLPDEMCERGIDSVLAAMDELSCVWHAIYKLERIEWEGHIQWYAILRESRRG